jgi:superfamily II DNA or RNA helicase
MTAQLSFRDDGTIIFPGNRTAAAVQRPTLKELYPYQSTAIGDLRHALRSKAKGGLGHRCVVLQMATGGGKTVVAASIFEMARRLGSRVIFTVPAIELINQTVERFEENALTDIGVIQADHPRTNPSCPIQVASVQTLARREVAPGDLVIVDECHVMHDSMNELLQKWTQTKFIGLSATPWTKGMGKFWDHLIVAATTETLIESGHLSRFRVFAPGHPDLSNVETVAGDFKIDSLSEVMQNPVLVADIVKTWLDRADNRSTLCFCVDRAHAKKVQQRFLEAGIACGYVDCHSKPDERKLLREQFASGEIKIVCNVGVLTTGVDWDVRCIILARPTKSEILFVQIIGRGLRTADVKDFCLILDHSDTHDRLGFVTDIHHDTLDDGRERQKAKPRDEPLVKECSQCAFLMPRKVLVCPNCGHERKPVSNLQEARGFLEERTPQAMTGHVATQSEKQMFYSELLWIENDRGYQDGWARANFKEKFGAWPQRFNLPPPIEPRRSTFSWVKSRQIAYAKRRGSR